MRTKTNSAEGEVDLPALVLCLREMRDVQGSNGNWNYDSYMHGMYNGMEYMLAMVENREPDFRGPPEEWLADRPEKFLRRTDQAEASPDKL